MDIIKNLLVGLDLTPMDDSELEYAAFLCTQSALESVFFVHAVKTTEIPYEFFRKASDNELAVKATIRKELEQKVGQYFKDLPQIQKEILVVNGDPVKELLKLAKNKDADLLLVGRKLRLKGSGVLPQKILRASPMSVFFIPENAAPVLNKVMVSIDFNEYAMMALDRILHSALTRPNIQIECLHIYQVPPGYLTLGVSYQEFDARMQTIAREKFDRVLQRFPELQSRATLKLVKQQNQDDDMGQIVVLEAKRSRADLLVIGAAGKSAAALFMLGSTTEKILRSDNDIPLLVFKRKDEKIGFIDALLRED